MKCLIIFTLLLFSCNAQDSLLQNRKKFTYSAYYSCSYLREVTLPQEFDFQLSANIKRRSKINLKIGLYYNRYNYDLPINVDKSNANYFVVPIYLGYQFRLGKNLKHSIKLDIGSKIWSLEPSKLFYHKTFWTNREEATNDYSSAYRTNLLLFAQLGYEFKLKEHVFFDFWITSHITQVLYNGDLNKKYLAAVPGIKLGLGYEF